MWFDTRARLVAALAGAVLAAVSCGAFAAPSLEGFWNREIRAEALGAGADRRAAEIGRAGSTTPVAASSPLGTSAA